MKKENVFRKWMLTLFLTILAVMMLFPIVFTLTNSFMTEQEIGSNYDSIGEVKKDTPFINLKLIPDLVSFEQYGTVLVKNPTFLKMFWNSVFMVVPIIVGQVIVASFAAYVFAKIQFRGRDKLFIVYLLTMLMPFQVTLVPNYIMADKLGILNSIASIILPGIFGAFGVFMLRQFMLHIPDAYIEAAKMDGAGHITIFFKIILPLIRPGIAALIVLLFADYWNMIEQPLIFLNDESKHPLSLYLSKINKEARGVGFSASILYMTPMILLFLYAQSYFIKGIQLSGVKE
ncbi:MULTISPECIES: carbohydrate ABC transporter permease [Bacillus]|uniref:Carbohydrate ABC transporter permease n=1 Tax=Bacillus pseudomycoides TaxID=64104 RepID=A0AAJ3R8M9_9BACI|nr:MULTISPECIES: ABC transporter permease subunit [Bacillus]EEM02814.1 Binding-protein-dependent transport system inner membrane component [Bacillus pseudomycoides]EEM08229.1 Binding-protein-dependent transport system inner membrane component [Bacillus pseudomycoides]KFN14102.1 binding--dependent transport system inner membrane component family protein [Bacillus pseudomycoides]MBD5800330.1 sugar ABC transporter permease [Bacillus pseudomycoides]MCR8855802.1 carbohydrate ABC transporter permeas